MTWTQLDQEFWVAGQINAADIDQAAALDFEVIVCNRPDGEAPDQPASADLQALAQAKGLDFRLITFTGSGFTAEQVEALKRLRGEGKKVLAYCRTGTRSTLLYNASLS